MTRTRRLLVLDIVGLTPSLLRYAPNVSAVADSGFVAPMDGVLPAVTCTAQATMLTGAKPREHGIVANGWYFRDLAEVWLWRQSNHLVEGPKLLDELADASPPVSVAKMFWWYNMYSRATWSVTPRPQYHADGIKKPDVYSEPPELRDSLQRRWGTFPLFDFWGPRAGLPSTTWIADASLTVWQEQRPELMLVYLPHLDYDLQRFGPGDARIPAQVAAADAEAGKLIDAARADGAEVFVVSEYGIGAVSGAVEINRVLREAGFLRARDAGHGELLDAGASRAFAVVDHQIAHVYVRDAADVGAVQKLLAKTEGVASVLDAEGKKATGLDHPRSGELIALSRPDRYFAYHYWFDEASAPDFARTVDIHNKPGYDPCELLMDPTRALLKPRILGKLLLKKAGLRVLMDPVPLDPHLVRGSHGLLPTSADESPLFISSSPEQAADLVAMISVKQRILHALGRG